MSPWPSVLRPRTAVAAGGVAAALLVATPVMASQVGYAGDGPALLLPVALLVGVGTVLASRRSGNAVGWILLATGLAWTTMGFLTSLARVLVRLGEPGAVTTAALWLSSWQWVPGLLLLPTFGFLLFPDGRLPSSRWRWAAWCSAAAMAALFVSYAITSWRTDEFDFPAHLENPLHSAVLEPVRAGSFALGAILGVVACGAGLVSLLVRFRRADDPTRHQIKWVLFGAVAAVVVYGTGNWTTQLPFVDWSLLTVLTLSIFPACMALAVLRYRLYEIDRIISRTLSYAVLSAVLVGIYAGLVFVLQPALRPVTGGSDLAVAGSTLAVAALFGPVRRRVQDTVDRRFNRNRYDAARTVEHFGQRLRNEIELASLAAELRGTALSTVQPRHASLWLPERDDVRSEAPVRGSDHEP